MNIQDKIDEIRKKPEHVRVRYAWTFSIIATFFVVMIWVISLVAQKEDNASLPEKPAVVDSPGISSDSFLRDESAVSPADRGANMGKEGFER